MENHVFALDEKNLKTVAFAEETIITSSKSHKDIDSLLASKKKSGLLESIKTIPVKDVTFLSYTEIESNLKLKYLKDGKEKSKNLPFDIAEERVDFTNSIAQKLNLKKDIATENKTTPLFKNLAIMAFVSFITYVLFDAATTLQNGGTIEVSGRRSGVKRLFVMAADYLGPTGSIIVGVIAIIITTFLTFKRWSNPSNTVTYRR